MGYLTTTTEVKRVSELTNEYTNAEIEKYIKDIEYEIFTNYPNFKKYSEITIDALYDDAYYIGERGKDLIYSVTKLREEDASDAGWSEIGSSDWTNSTYEATIVVPSAVQTGSDGVKYRVDWIPASYHRLATLMVKKELIAQGLVFTNDNADSVREERIDSQLETIKKGIRGKGTFLRSEAYASYDPNEYLEYEQFHTD